MEDATFQPAGLTEDGRAIVDSSGNTVEFDDPRVVFIWPSVASRHQIKMLKYYFNSWGFNFRDSSEVSHEILKYAKNICSGRECLPFNSIAGSMYKDYISNIDKDPRIALTTRPTINHSPGDINTKDFKSAILLISENKNKITAYSKTPITFK